MKPRFALSIILMVFCLPQYAKQRNSSRDNQSHIISILDSLHGKTCCKVKDSLQTKDSWRNISNYLRLDFFATLHAYYFIHARDLSSEQSSVYGYYNFSILDRFQARHLAINLAMNNELGYRKYIDSIACKNEDLWVFKTDLLSTLRKGLKFSLSYQIKSQLWNTWLYHYDAANQLQRTLYAGFYSPGYVNYSAGLTYLFWKNCQLQFGLLSAQMTFIKNTKIFETRAQHQLYGLERSSPKQTKWGWCLQTNIPTHKIRKRWYWDHSHRFFYQHGEISQKSNWTIESQNGIYFLFLKYLRLGVLSRMNYDKVISDKVYISNTLLFGFYLSNKL